MIICITRRYIPDTLDLLHSFKTDNQNNGKHLLIKNTSSKPLGSGPVFSLSCKFYSLHLDKKVQISKLPLSKFHAALCIRSHILLALLSWFSALDQ